MQEKNWKITEIRPSLVSIMMETAEKLSSRSTCQRLKVGCVITDPDMRVMYGMGYNGSYAGGPNHCDDPSAIGGCGCVHAEHSCIINLNAARHVDKLVFVTHSPCTICSKSLINLGGVQKVYYRNEYRITTGLELLRSVGIETIHLVSTTNGNV